jgi:hypothetical protein
VDFPRLRRSPPDFERAPKSRGSGNLFRRCYPKFRSQPPTQEPEPQGGLTPDFLALSVYCDPSREFNFWRPTPSALLALGFRSYTDIPALKELEEWFETQKEIRTIAKLDPFFERTSKLASRRLKREIERRGTLGEFALEPDPSHLKRIPPEESGPDLFRSDGPDAVELSCQAESPQSVMQGCPAQKSAVEARKKES